MSAELKILSGGQTGADRAALDWAIANNVAHGGWCPKGRRAEDSARQNSRKSAASRGFKSRRRMAGTQLANSQTSFQDIVSRL